MSIRVESDLAEGEHGIGGVRSAATKDCFDAPNELLDAEGLMDEIISASLEAGARVIAFLTGGQHDDGSGVTRIAHACEGFETVDLGHVDVEHD